MIAFIEGTLEEVEPLKVLINAQGIGYEIHTPLSSTSQVGPTGNNVRLLTQLVVREDSQTLYGLVSKSEKQAFIALTEKVSGIGPKIALNILSRLSVESLKSAIAAENVSLLTKCPGIGKKTAERLVLELKDVFDKIVTGSTSTTTVSDNGLIVESSSNPLVDDAVAALVTLGFKPAEAQKRVEKLLTSASEQLNVEQLIKQALNG